MVNLKKLSVLILLILCSTSLCFAAIDNAMVWEARTTGASTNGGGYKTGASGTDYSQQDTVQESYTTLTTSGIGVTTVTCSGADTFDANIVGNLIQIASGTNVTAGFYEVTARGSSTSITVDRAPDDGVGGIASGVGVMGGALDHPHRMAAAYTKNNILYIKSGTYVKIGANTFVFQPTVSLNQGYFKVVGYDTSRSTIPTGTNRPLLDGNSDTATCFSETTRVTIENIRFENATGDGATGAITYYNCKFAGNGDDGVNAENSSFVNCEFSSNTGDGNSWGNNTPKFVNCYSHDNTIRGFNGADTRGSGIIFNSIADSNGGFGFITANPAFVNCVAYNNTGASTDGFRFNGNAGANRASSGTMLNCSSVSNGRYAFSADAAYGAHFIFDYNNYFGHTTELNNITAGDSDTGDADPTFTLPGSGDFTLQSGSPCLDAGSNVHDLATGVVGDYKTNIGADQDDVSAGGGTTNILGGISAHTNF